MNDSAEILLSGQGIYNKCVCSAMSNMNLKIQRFPKAFLIFDTACTGESPDTNQLNSISEFLTDIDKSCDIFYQDTLCNWHQITTTEPLSMTQLAHQPPHNSFGLDLVNHLTRHAAHRNEAQTLH